MDILRTKQNTSLLMTLMLALIPALLLGGCSTTQTTVKSGFLVDYSQLVTAPNHDNARIYQREDFKLSNIKKIKVVPF